MFVSALKFQEPLPPDTLLLLLTLLTCLIGLADYLTGTDTTFSGLYLFPIWIAAWFLGRRVAYGFAIRSSVFWVGGDVLAGAYYFSIFIPVWNVTSRFVVFIVVPHFVVPLRNPNEQLENRRRERA